MGRRRRGYDWLDSTQRKCHSTRSCKNFCHKFVTRSRENCLRHDNQSRCQFINIPLQQHWQISRGLINEVSRAISTGSLGSASAALLPWRVFHKPPVTVELKRAAWKSTFPSWERDRNVKVKSKSQSKGFTSIGAVSGSFRSNSCLHLGSLWLDGKQKFLFQVCLYHRQMIVMEPDKKKLPFSSGKLPF